MMRKFERLWILALIGTAVLSVVSSAAEPPVNKPRAWLGFGYTRHTFDAKSPIRQWLYVQRVETGSPAMAAGLRVQDAIVMIDGRNVSFASDAAALKYFASLNAKSVLRLVVLRHEKRVAVVIRAAPLPAERADAWRRNAALAKQTDSKRPAKQR